MTMDLAEFLTDLHGGTFEQKLSRALADTAAAVIDNEAAGKVIVTFDMKAINAAQVNVKHQVKYERPTRNGKHMEQDTTSTPMHVGEKGAMSFFPKNQGQFFTQQGEVASTEE
jgi:hypothetical protein